MGSPPLCKEYEQRNPAVDRAKDRPVGRAMALKAGMDNVFRLVRLVGLRNQAPAPRQRILHGSRQLGKCVDR